MPRSRIRSGKLAAQTMSNALIASARNLTLRSPGPVKRIRADQWQKFCWHSYDVVEVYHYAVQWVGNTLSRAKLVVMHDGTLVESGPAFEVLQRFFGGPDQHGEFLRQAAIHMTVAGDGYLVEQRDSDEDWWGVVAAVEMRETATGYKFDGEVLDPDNSLVMRMWRPHPLKPSQSDCPTRPLLPVLNQLEKLTMYVDAQLDSRLTGNGLMLFPNSMAFPTPTENAEGETALQAGLLAFMKEWAEVMGVAKQNPSSPSARVPTGLMGDGDDLDKVRHVTTWSELDEHAPALRQELITRIALGLDMPADALLGSSGGEDGGQNHWSAWQTDDSLIKAHAEPLLALICQAITTDYLHIILEDEFGMAWEDAVEFTIEADTADMRLRPNRSKEALEMWDRGELNGVALRRENGFEETDAMDEAEKKDWLLRKVAQGSPSPEFVQWAARALGISVPDLEPEEAADDRGERPLPRSLKEHPVNEPPQRPAAAAELLAAGEMALFRCLERAGNRLKSTGAKIEGIPSGVKALDRYQFVTLSREQLNDVMTDAWSNLDRLTLPEGVTHAAFETALDNYARMLISSRQPYDRDVLSKYLALALKDEA